MALILAAICSTGSRQQAKRINHLCGIRKEPVCQNPSSLRVENDACAWRNVTMCVAAKKSQVRMSLCFLEGAPFKLLERPERKAHFLGVPLL